jgi:ketohexokinase
MSLILLTGTITLDIINTVTHYPQEDEEIRACSQRVTVGGNATNTAMILSSFKHRCEVVSTLAQDQAADMLKGLLSERSITLTHCQICEGSTPTSYITLNQSNGSRSIVHYRNLAELSAEHFCQIPVERYDWLHFEGRNVAQLALMLQHAREQVIDQPISLEVEKARAGLSELIPYTDLVMFSRPYARTLGFEQADTFLKAQQQQYGKIWMTCTWAEQGAWAIDQYGECWHVPAQLQGTPLDTLGAGDTFNAGLIHALVTGNPLDTALEQAVMLAGRKIQQIGLIC